MRKRGTEDNGVIPSLTRRVKIGIFSSAARLTMAQMSDIINQKPYISHPRQFVGMSSTASQDESTKALTGMLLSKVASLPPCFTAKATKYESVIC